MNRVMFLLVLNISLIACLDNSDKEEESLQLSFDIKRLVAEYDRFNQAIIRQEFSAEQIYDRGLNLTIRLGRLYERRDSTVAGNKSLLRARDELIADFKGVQDKVDRLKQEMLDITDRAEKAAADAEAATAKINQREAELDSAFAANRLQREIAERNLKRTGIEYFKNSFHNNSELSPLTKKQNQALDQYRRAKEEHNALLKENDRFLKSILAMKEDTDQTVYYLTQEMAKVELNLETAYTDWSWLKPYIDLLVETSTVQQTTQINR